MDKNTITYDDLFKNEFYRLTNHGCVAKNIFSKLGVDPEDDKHNENQDSLIHKVDIEKA